MHDAQSQASTHSRWRACVRRYSLYEEVTRVPLVISVPGLTTIASGGLVNEIVETIDILPTILDLWGVQRGADLTCARLACIRVEEQ